MSTLVPPSLQKICFINNANIKDEISRFAQTHVLKSLDFLVQIQLYSKYLVKFVAEKIHKIYGSANYEVQVPYTVDLQ